MNSEKYSTELISREVRELIQTVDEFMQTKTLIAESIKQMYLRTSNNN